jgi:CHAD domain-containing protein
MAGKPEQVHGFRKDIKTFRYLAEFFAPLFSELARASFNADLRSLQDALGSLNDQIVVARMAGDKSVSPDPEMQRETARAAEVWARMSRNLAPWRGDQPTLRP